MEADIHDKDKAVRIVMKQLDERAEQVKLSEDFTDQLMERIRQEQRASKMTLLRRHIGFAVGIAAALALLVGIALHVMQGDNHVSQQVAKKESNKVEKVEMPQKEVEETKDIAPTRTEKRLLTYASAPVSKVVEEEIMEESEASDSLPSLPEEDDQDVCWILIPNTPFALRYSLTWESEDEGASKANVSAVECVTIEENDTVLIKSPSGEISRGSMFVYEGEKKENDFVYVRDGRLLTADVRIYYKKAFLNADGQTYSYVDALALLDYPTCSLCMND